ncbi:MAG: 4-hydroxythreonine-4-phosphate dehydrogenase PdxA [Candidatus Tectomicrobia bacterium]|uniref:4-hydroxythreonine-4-phosphate dehydrogenase PdxA n=1 Tax=Tectimicrobiota bacterium TaxID=2528274 RepID=A0A932GMU2_UNCTE|nr:4-hydroxythreonine-4-phosphate dehydrogenase PdxA [Candidatus Tectomicrobia bacterium]
MKRKPVIAVTPGDPAGIGPEITLKALASRSLHRVCHPIIIGETKILKECARAVGIKANLKSVRTLETLKTGPNTVTVFEVAGLGTRKLVPGKISAAAGKASLLYLEKAFELARAGIVDAIATAPIHKEAIHRAGARGIGHTELLAELSGGGEPLTLFVCGRLKIFFLTRHLSLRAALREVTYKNVLTTLLRIREEMRALGTPRPRIAVAALNPHAGDGGLLGREEIEKIGPAIKDARRRGVAVDGPVAADSVFHLALAGKYDCVLSLYHDQGHIAAKTYDFEGSVSVTLGLPVLRTSVDHGTAFDIAWQGVASPKSMIEAIKVAAQLARKRRKREAGITL